MNPRPHKRKKKIKGNSSGMAGFSAGAEEGLGLSDKGQQAFNAAKRAGLSSGYERYLFDVQSMLVPGTNQLKGMYQLSGSPQYAGGKGSFDTFIGSSGGILTRSTGGAPTGIGSLVAKQGGGMGWFRKNSALGLPPAEEKSETRSLLAMGGLAYIMLKVLL